MPSHYPGPVHCNSLSNPVTWQFVPVRQQRAIYGVTGSLSVRYTECSPAFWAGHCAVHGYSPVVVLCSVLK